jgi:hypothetical protein
LTGTNEALCKLKFDVGIYIGATGAPPTITLGIVISLLSLIIGAPEIDQLDGFVCPP